jgi:hypothetical protein
MLIKGMNKKGQQETNIMIWIALGLGVLVIFGLVYYNYIYKTATKLDLLPTKDRDAKVLGCVAAMQASSAVGVGDYCTTFDLLEVSSGRTMYVNCQYFVDQNLIDKSQVTPVTCPHGDSSAESKVKCNDLKSTQGAGFDPSTYVNGDTCANRGVVKSTPAELQTAFTTACTGAAGKASNSNSCATGSTSIPITPAYSGWICCTA